MRLAKEIIELNDIIQIKNNEIDYLKNVLYIIYICIIKYVSPSY